MSSSLRARLRISFAACLLLPACFPDPDALVVPPASIDGGDLGAVDGASDGVVVPIVAGVNCADFSVVYCARLQECMPRSMQLRFGAPAACPARMELWCHRNLADPQDTNWNEAAFKGCTANLATTSCLDWQLTGDDLKGQDCIVSGKRPLGVGCAAGAQCQSVRCRRFGNSGNCGRCVPRQLKDGDCQVDFDCVPGLFCSAARKCKPAQPDGASCDDDNPCNRSLRCQDGRCVRPGGQDAPCTSDADCDVEAFFSCNAALHRCGRATPAARWDNMKADGTVDLCADGGYQAAGGMCVPLADEGEPCANQGDGARCRAPALCRVPFRDVVGRCLTPVLPACPAVRPDPPAGGYPPGEDPWCPGLDFPTFCPAASGFSDDCWTAGSVCSTRVECKGVNHACNKETDSYDCQLRRCGPSCSDRTATSPCETCTFEKCCGVKSLCDFDPMCHDGGTGPAAGPLATCLTTYCAKECAPP